MKSEKYKDFIKNADKPIALVLNLGLNGLGVVRSLGRRCIPVIGFDPNPKQMERLDPVSYKKSYSRRTYLL